MPERSHPPARTTRIGDWLSGWCEGTPCGVVLQILVVVGLILVGVTASFHWIAGFTMGMSLADTFGTSGGDAEVTGSLIALIGQAALVAALFVGLVPQSVSGEAGKVPRD